VKILIYPQWEKYLQQYDSLQPDTKRKEQDRERKLFRLVIIECGLRLQRVRNGCEKRNE